MVSEIVDKMRKQAIKSVMDILMLYEIKNGPISGYDAMVFINNKFEVFISSGTIYSHLYALERNELVKGVTIEGKRIYELTAKGEKTLKNLTKSNLDLLNSLKNMSKTEE
ncbi:MAG: PadR family transcriptional regulator [Candidatus Bathyarchaeia archaeon]|jgi:DNA-binding PadR family transcriptional regulator